MNASPNSPPNNASSPLATLAAQQQQQQQQQPPLYRYSPQALVASYARLKESSKEEEMMLEVPRSLGVGGDVDSDTSMRVVPPDEGEETSWLVVAATQLTGAGLPDSDVAGFCFRAEQAIAQAVTVGNANLVLLPELWSGPYFCQSPHAALVPALSEPVEHCVLIKRMQLLARTYNVVLPISFYENCHTVYYNSVVVIDADGSLVGRTYRKSHIPDGTGYQEKFYFTPGDSGFQVYDTRVGRIGVAICWDQWFPEAARAMALQGADVLLYPTAIGSEPQNPNLQSANHWQRVMQGHAAANMIPVVASNRYGTEVLLHDDGITELQRIHFYGRSFITDNTGAIVAECGACAGGDSSSNSDHPHPVVTVVTAEIDKAKNVRERAAWGLFRDRRPDLYSVILTKDGQQVPPR